VHVKGIGGKHWVRESDANATSGLSTAASRLADCIALQVLYVFLCVCVCL